MSLTTLMGSISCGFGLADNGSDDGSESTLADPHLTEVRLEARAPAAPAVRGSAPSSRSAISSPLRVTRAMARAARATAPGTATDAARSATRRAASSDAGYVPRASPDWTLYLRT